MLLQQGDILISKIDSLPKCCKSLKTRDIERSQTTGHAHKLSGGDCSIKSKDNKKFILVKRQTVLKHEEHKPIKIPKGIYEIRKVVEYDHFTEEARQVQD